MIPVMNRSVLLRAAKLLRLPALVLIMLTVLVNPVLAAVGDLHESSHGSVGHMPAPSDHDPDHDGNAGTEGEDADFLHTLMHAAHCCGHLAAILSSPFPPQARQFSEVMPMPLFAAPGTTLRTDHFRPPIAI